MLELISEEEQLARQLASATISKLEGEQDHGAVVDPKARTLIGLPRVPLTMILSLVASRTFNPAPRYHEFLKARSAEDLQCRQKKADAEYAVKNLMSLRRVCRKFETFVNNMVPAKDFEPIAVDVKLQGNSCTREVKFFKYGGTGSQHTCTRLTRIRRFDEDKDHIENFEKINQLYIVDMPLSEELFETLRRLNLKFVKKITFERISDVKFNEDVDIPTYIQQFLDSLESSPLVLFNSNEFDPNVVLFRSHSEDRAEPMEIDVRHEIEKLNTRQRHRRIRSRRIEEVDDDKYREKRRINIVSNVLLGNSLSPSSSSESSQKECLKQIRADLCRRTKGRSEALKKAGRYHLRKVLLLLEHVPLKSRNAVYFHLKMLKKISGMEPIVSDEEKSLLERLNEEKARRRLLNTFPFLDKLPRVHRKYLGDADKKTLAILQ